MTSHIVFDSSYVSDTWDWFESVLIVMDQELWYDPTLGHSHLREFFYRMTIMSRHTLLNRWRIFEPCPFLRGYQMSFFTLEHETWLAHFIWCTLHRGIPLSVDDGFFRYSCFLEAIRFISHWSTRYDWVISLMWSREHSLLIIVGIFFEMIGSGHGHLWEHAAEFSHFRVCPILGHNPFIGGWS